MVKIIRNNKSTIITGPGSITITNGKISVDGKPLSEIEVVDPDEKEINITIEGNIERLEVDYCNTIKVTGNAKRVKTNQGDIEVGGDVSGDIHTNMGDITCGNVEGDCHTNMGSIYRK